MIIIIIAIYGLWCKYNDICASGDCVMKFEELTVWLQLCACTASVYLCMLIVCTCVSVCVCMCVCVCVCVCVHVMCVH